MIFRRLFTVASLLTAMGFSLSCNQITKPDNVATDTSAKTKEEPEYFLLRPELEKHYGYSHAVRVGDDLKISGAVSMDNNGNIVDSLSMEKQMKNCYADLEKILKHYGYSFDEVVVENIFTTDMPGFLKVAGYRREIYKKQFPTGSWLEVKGLAVPGQLVEIEMEAHKVR